MKPTKSISEEIQKAIIAATGNIVANHTDKNQPTEQILSLISDIYRRFATEIGKIESYTLTPFVDIKDSVKNDYIICLEDGKKLKMLKRYLKTKYNLTADEYREKWDLPRDYPMTAPNYAKSRATIAKKTGLGKSKS